MAGGSRDARAGWTERVLDISCDDGRITAEIARRLGSGSVLGIDPSTHMIDFAKAHFAEPEYPNLAFAVGDATAALPFRGEFDLVVSFNALHWVRDQNAALRGIREALKPTGRAFLEFVPQGPRKCLEDVIEETCRAERCRRARGLPWCIKHWFFPPVRAGAVPDDADPPRSAASAHRKKIARFG